MSLKAFHLVFITASTVLAFGFCGWLLNRYVSPEGRAIDLVFGFVAFAAAGGLIVYERCFVKKTKNVKNL